MSYRWLQQKSEEMCCHKKMLVLHQMGVPCEMSREHVHFRPSESYSLQTFSLGFKIKMVAPMQLLSLGCKVLIKYKHLKHVTSFGHWDNYAKSLHILGHGLLRWGVRSSHGLLRWCVRSSHGFLRCSDQFPSSSPFLSWQCPDNAWTILITIQNPC